MKNLFKLSAAVLLLLAAVPLQAQKVGLKTNLLSWAAGGTINLAGELKTGPKTTINLGVAGNPWTFGTVDENKKIWHWTVQPEVRFWRCEAFNRGFFGVHALAGSFDAGGIKLPLGIFPGLKDHRYEGWMAGVGASYGWQWYLTPHWNLEATFGFGYIYMKYNEFECVQCGDLLAENVVKHYFGPTKIGVSFSYMFKSKK